MGREQSKHRQSTARCAFLTDADQRQPAPLGFYQRRGYQFRELYVNAVDKARRIKPEIPLVADNGIPIRDEILLVKKL